MNISFIVTSYNIQDYIAECLESVIACARAGDEIIIVDDGSTDETYARVRAFARGPDLPQDVDIRPVFLGANTFGGVGIAANIGMDHARKDTVFFVDGDDWLNPEAFDQCRDVFAARGGDFMLVNYSEFNQAANRYAAPADQARWARVQKGMAASARLELALSFIAVPWRKFYRRQFLVAHNLRFPEGDFFFEDNPFHWAVCRAAQNYSFYNQVICYHRTNRPGQTMASTGVELLAFFTHYQSILAGIKEADQPLRAPAMHWLINNMSWHLNRLHPTVLSAWAQRAQGCLQAFPDEPWQKDIAPAYLGTHIGDVCEQLRRGDLAGFLNSQQIKQLERQINSLHEKLNAARHEAQQAKQYAQIIKNTQEYTALLALGRKP